MRSYCCATAALALPLLVLAIAYTALPWISRVQVGPEVSVFVKSAHRAREIEALRAQLAASAGVASVRLIPRDQAYAELCARSGIAAASGEHANPLPDVLVARFAMDAWIPPRSSAPLPAARQWPGVDAVQADLQWYRRLIAGGARSCDADAGARGLTLGLGVPRADDSRGDPGCSCAATKRSC